MNDAARTVFGLLSFVCVEMNNDQKAYLEKKIGERLPDLDDIYEECAKITEIGCCKTRCDHPCCEFMVRRASQIRERIADGRPAQKA